MHYFLSKIKHVRAVLKYYFAASQQTSTEKLRTFEKHLRNESAGKGLLKLNRIMKVLSNGFIWI